MFFNNLIYVKELVIISIVTILIGIKINKNYLKFMGCFLLFILVFFFRNNLKTLEKNNNIFISPSSSKITDIIYGNRYNIILTYLSPLDRHFMIAPVDCTIIDIKFGKQEKSDAERLSVTFKDKSNKIFKLDQIVSKLGYGSWILGIMYRRCILFKKIGDKLKQGERYGLIRFGSSMKYTLPKSYKINVIMNNHYNLGDAIAYL